MPSSNRFEDNPVVGFSFMLRVEGVYDLPCRAIRGFQKENEFEYVQEGGQNDFVHMLRKPISKPFTFQVERYAGVDVIDPLPLGSEPILPIILFVNNSVFPTLDAVKTYVFTGCTVTAKDYGELDAEKSGLVVERTTIAYREMLCVSVPAKTYLSDYPSFKDYTENKEDLSKLKLHAKKNDGEKSKSDMIAKAEEFNYLKRSRQGDPYIRKRFAQTTIGTEKSKRSEQIDKDTNAATSKQEMEKKADANKWPAKKRAKVNSETSKEEMGKKADANKWPTKKRAKVNSETSKEEMEKKADANKWPPKKNAKAIAALLSKTKEETENS